MDLKMFVTFTSRICFCIFVLCQLQKLEALQFHMETCNQQTSDSNIEYAKRNGRLVDTVEVNGTLEVYEQVNNDPTWTYFKAKLSLNNGTVNTAPRTQKIYLELNIEDGGTTTCRRYYLDTRSQQWWEQLG
ncbi:hypothetical protein C0J52_08470 [Blattella germanica]|nr:hypothetical protein C0J52_08470 [Blattella germanica]